MLVTCTCGKKLFFGDDPNEQQTCDRCGQKIRSPLSGEPPPQAAVGVPRQAASRGSPLPVPRKPTPLPRGPAAENPDRLYIASDRGGGAAKRLGCVVAAVVVLGGPFVLDLLARPAVKRPCGHEGKWSYGFGLVRAHMCESLRALKFLDAARREVIAREAQGRGRVENIETLYTVLTVGDPPKGTPYLFRIDASGHLLAYPADESKGLPHFLMERDGTIHTDPEYEPTLGSPTTGKIPDAR